MGRLAQAREGFNGDAVEGYLPVVPGGSLSLEVRPVSATVHGISRLRFPVRQTTTAYASDTERWGNPLPLRESR